MKSFTKNLLLGVDFKLYFSPLMYKINTRNRNKVRSQDVMLTGGRNAHKGLYVIADIATKMEMVLLK